MYKNLIKPIFDFLFALIALIIALPILVIAWILLLIANRGQAFFVQPRPGKDQKIFNIVKFKTMNDAKDDQGNPLPDDERLTGIGRFVRKTSIDELPQLFNIIRGDMSFVGPRPWLVEYLPLYNDYQLRRHEVKPGITGWAQVNGRNLLGWDDRFEKDVYYVDHISLLFDLKIIFMTISKVFSGKGVSAANVSTMRKFTGNE